MNVLLSHVDMGPVFYGIILAIWALVFIYNICAFNVLEVALDVVVFYIVFSMHHGSMTGGMAAVVCGIIVSFIGSAMIRRIFK